MNEAPMTADQRKRAVAWVVALTAQTDLAPQRYERQLLGQFERGEIALEAMSSLMENSVYRVLYHSRSVGRPSDAALQALLDWSRPYNAAHGITGLLLYSDGRYVQVLEGSEAAVSDLFAHIQRDARHEQVTAVSQGPGPRRFAEWSMDFGRVAAPELNRALNAIEVAWPFRAPPVRDARLTALLDAFL